MRQSKACGNEAGVPCRIVLVPIPITNEYSQARTALSALDLTCYRCVEGPRQDRRYWSRRWRPCFLFRKNGPLCGLIDNEYTNFNRLEGARILKEKLNSSVEIRSVDLDSQLRCHIKIRCRFLSRNALSLKEPFFRSGEAGASDETLFPGTSGS